MSHRTHPDRGPASGSASRKWWGIASAILILVGCQSPSAASGYSAANLLILDPSDSITASSDMLAVYSFQTRQSVSFRIDLLDFSQENAPSFILLLDTFPGSTTAAPHTLDLEDRWEAVLSIFPDRNASVETGVGESFDSSAVVVTYDPRLDTVSLTIPLQAIRPPGPFEFAIVSIDASNHQPADTVGPIRSDVASPEPIPMLLTFWNVFPSATPAQALRSWDGAHNGPAGERFGLRHLLEAVEVQEVPVILIDLKQPASLGGLQLLGADTWLIELEQRHLLSLPDTLPAALCDQAAGLGWPDWMLDRVGLDAERLGFRKSTALACTPGFYRPGGLPFPAGYRSLLIHPVEAGHDATLEVQDVRDGQVITLFSGITTAALNRQEDLALDLRRQLVASLDPDQAGTVVLLSINFQHSFWGDPGQAQEALSWIAAHPWIKPLTLDEYDRSGSSTLLNPDGLQEPDPDRGSRLPSMGFGQDKVIPLLNDSGSESLRALTWHLLYEANASPSCLHHNSAVGAMLEMTSSCETLQNQTYQALEWLSWVHAWDQLLVKDPPDQAIKTLLTSLNAGSSAAIYANDQWFAIVNPAGNRLAALFASIPQLGATPLIWDPASFDDASTTDGEMNIEFRDQSGHNALWVEFQRGSSSGPLLLPIYLSPRHLDRTQACLSPGSETNKFKLACIEGLAWTIEIQGGIGSLDSVLDSPGRWNLVEDPNQEMPGGHFLPIPYALFSVDFKDRLTLVMNLNE